MLSEDAIEAGGAAARGLVSVPTTPRRACGVEVQELRRVLKAFAPDPLLSRLARLRRAVGFSARAHAVGERGHRSEVAVMVTLTYRDAAAWAPGHVARFIDLAGKWIKARGVAMRYLWVAELQKQRLQQRGEAALHYHVVLWLPRGVKLPKPDVCGWWPHGMTQRVVARKAIGYLLNYCKKGDADLFAHFPKGARAYGVGGLDAALRRARAWLALPAFVQARAAASDVWRRVTGGGWCSPAGDVWPSEYVRTVVGDTAALIRVRDHGRPFEVAGPFEWVRNGVRTVC